MYVHIVLFNKRSSLPFPRERGTANKKNNFSHKKDSKAYLWYMVRYRISRIYGHKTRAKYGQLSTQDKKSSKNNAKRRASLDSLSFTVQQPKVIAPNSWTGFTWSRLFVSDLRGQHQINMDRFCQHLPKYLDDYRTAYIHFKMTNYTFY